MKISYDEECDAMSITFKETTVTAQKVAEGVALEFDADGHLAGIEILDAVRPAGSRIGECGRGDLRHLRAAL